MDFCRINDRDISYQWCYHPSTQVTLHGVRGKRQEVSHKANRDIEDTGRLAKAVSRKP